MKPTALILIGWWFVITAGPAAGRYGGPFVDEEYCEKVREAIKANYPKTSYCWEGPKPLKDSDDIEYDD